jgi:hypothetical protein
MANSQVPWGLEALNGAVSQPVLALAPAERFTQHAGAW